MIRSDGMLKLLLVESSLTEADNIINILRSAGHAVRASREESLSGIEQALMNQTWDMIISRANLAAVPPRELVNFVYRLGRDIPCIAIIDEQQQAEELYDVAVQDIVQLHDSRRLQFAVKRELDNLFNRRTARRNERALRESEKRSRLLLETSKDAVAYMHEGMHIYVNSAYLNLFGYQEAEEVDGLPILDLIAADDQNQFKTVFRQFSEQAETQPAHVVVQCVREDSSVFEADIEFSHAEVEGEACTQVVIRDQSTQEQVDSDQLQLLRDHDFLTGLYNRVRFMDELELVAGRAADNNGDAALLYIVIEEFQAIKEQTGVANSEQILKGLAEQLKKGLVEGDLLAHYADQVFTVIVDSDDDDYVDVRAQTYQQIVKDFTTQVGDKTIDLQCSIGISRISETSFNVDTVLNQADKACVQAQNENDQRIRRYQPVRLENGETEVDEASKWKFKLEEAIKNEHFALHFQPIVSLHGREQELYEVLLRMVDDDQETLIVAEDFIDYATEFSMMATIDKWVIPHAFQVLEDHQKQYPKTRFFIKLSKQTVRDKEFTGWLVGQMQQYQIAPESLTFEVSETDALMHIDDTKSTIDKLKAIGCEFGLEHFGSGVDFSSSLGELDVDYVKINGTFVENMAKDSENQAAVKAIIEMSKEAGKQSIAEFVSDANSLALLWRLGVDYAQGYYIHAPSAELNYNFEDDDL